ncbi:MAG: hypothetical protein U5K29_08780 [Acidimicrobiales bacterium]|nr:hypothetical protein [Acidimicrobiales bacterium]
MNLDHLTDADLDRLVDGARQGRGEGAEHDVVRELSAELALGPVPAARQAATVAAAATAAGAAVSPRADNVVAMRPRVSNRAKAAVVASVVMVANVAPLAADPLPMNVADRGGLLHHITGPFADPDPGFDHGAGVGRAVVVNTTGESVPAEAPSTTDAPAPTEPPVTEAPDPTDAPDPTEAPDPTDPPVTQPADDYDYYTGPELKPELPTDPDAEPVLPPPPADECSDGVEVDPATGECLVDDGTGNDGDGHGQVLPPPPPPPGDDSGSGDDEETSDTTEP